MHACHLMATLLAGAWLELTRPAVQRESGAHERNVLLAGVAMTLATGAASLVFKHAERLRQR